MIDLLRRIGRGESAAAIAEPGEADPAPTGLAHEVEFAAYAEDCRIYGFIEIEAERLSDALNDAEAYQLRDVLLVDLEDLHAAEVRVAGPRGNLARRGRTRPSPLTLKAGPYTIHGYLHAPPGADPILAMRRRKPMVPLTEAWIEYASGAEFHRARVGAIIVNRELLDWVRLSRDEEVRLPGLPAETAVDPRAKDLTGYIFTPGFDEEGET